MGILCRHYVALTTSYTERVKVSIGGRNITSLRFADDMEALGEEEQDLEALVESLDKTCTRYRVEISAEKTKLVTTAPMASRGRLR